MLASSGTMMLWQMCPDPQRLLLRSRLLALRPLLRRL